MTITKLIVRFMEFIIELIAFLLMLGGGVLGVIYGMGLDDGLLIILFGSLGVFLGLIIATIVLGVPLLAMKINQNLEEINSKL